MPVIDVRSPAEFDHGHISGAINMPVFSNEERSIIGSLYVQQGSSEAIMKGLGSGWSKNEGFCCISPGYCSRR